MIPIDSLQIPKEHYLPLNIKLADPYFYRPGKIDVLLRAEVFYQLLRFGQLEMPNSELKFQNSVFGFITTGDTSNSQSEKMKYTHCGLIYDYSDIGNDIKKFWQLESIGIKDDPSYNRNTVKDHLIVGTQSLVDSLSNNEDTKRHLLRAIGKIFDTFGLLTPFTFRVKCILQVLWMKEISWDEKLPLDIQKMWYQWVSEVPRLSELQVPRYVFSSSTGEPTDVLELHYFCDASQKAYGVVILWCCYIHVKDCNTEVNLLVSKRRVSPLTKITMPRLELLGALLAARLASKVKAIVDLKRPSKVFFWTDSNIALHWIKGSSKRWKSFVSNRVTEIQSLCDTSAWAHCPGKQNPADFLSRAVSVEILLNGRLWWKGPQFLREVDFPTDTGNDDTSISLHGISDELKKTSGYSPLTITVINHNSLIDDILKISNNYKTIIRVRCYVFRFIHNFKNIERLTSHLIIKELQRAENYLVQLVQQGEFAEEVKNLRKDATVPSNSKVKSLNCFLDESGILRFGGRLKYTDLSLDEKHPIVLPDKHPLTLIIARWRAWLECCTTGSHYCFYYQCKSCDHNKELVIGKKSVILFERIKSTTEPANLFVILSRDIY
ncbi:hypothetical protein AVEN_164569-1 [Araneus ventricosus]|uniref:Peptidase aspartic putative domain-containing protein n=1 Tax=Araneus ventricosus TaxID=182803 RepID=A0A4Y2B231_ARAVE|nr:hypothetical protein AVEN_164569-1 [Araneus ventricosus]